MEFDASAFPDQPISSGGTAPSTHAFATAPSSHAFATAPFTRASATAPSSRASATAPSTRAFATASFTSASAFDASAFPDQPTENPKSRFGSIMSEFGKGAIKTATNIPQSAVQFGKAIAQPILHPVETIQNVGETLGGGMEKVLPSGAKNAPQNVAKFDALVNFFKQRYGGIEALKQTIQNDPVGFAADVSSVLTAGGGALSKVGELSKIESLANAAGVVSKIGAVTEPLNVVPKTIPIVGKGIGEALGISTGAGGESVRQAFTNATPEFKAAMRGSTSGTNIVEDAKSAFEAIKEQRRQEYVQQLPKAVNNPIQFNAQIQSLKQSLMDKMKNFKVGLNADGEPDFSRSTISRDGQGVVGEAISKINDWGSQSGDFSVEGLDTLKRQLDDLIPKSGEARAFITPLKKQVRDTLVSNVPEYGKLVKDYETASNDIKDIGQAFSLSGNAGADTILRKLNQTLRQNFELRKQFADKLDQMTGGNLISEIAGSQMNPLAPRGLARNAAQVEAMVGGVAAAKGIMNPAYLGVLAASSPRLVGETLSIIGIPAQKIGQIFRAIYTPATAQTAFQVGRIRK